LDHGVDERSNCQNWAETVRWQTDVKLDDKDEQVDNSNE
jgi:hypothetical protein